MAKIRGLLRRDRGETAAIATAEPNKIAAKHTPPLIVLLPDAQGLAAHKMHRFDSARDACDFIEEKFRGKVAHGAVAFWALTAEPEATDETEPLVLVRDSNLASAYVFSFSKLDACHEFVRSEIARGSHLEQMMVYWAAPASITTDLSGRVLIDPPYPPRLRHRGSPVPEKSGAETENTSVLRFPGSGKRGAHEQGPPFLKDADIAGTIREMEAFKARFDALRPSVIDFPTVRSARRQRKQRPAAFVAWNNFSKAIDEALDVHVAQRVRLQLAINRIVRALARAANLHHEQAAFNKRWERREEPFNGFDSPPGRF